MNLYIIRHGESTWNSQNKIQGNSNPGLSRFGRLQARLLAGRFAKIKVEKIYSSPLLRASQTARAMGKALKLKIIMKEQLKEVMLGDWEGRTPEEIDSIYNDMYKKWLRRGPTKIKIPRAEDIGLFRKRIDEALDDIIRENQHKENVVVVTHGGVIASFLARLLKADFNRMVLNLHIPNTCVTLVAFKKRKGCLIHIADTLHLSPAKAKDTWPS